MSERMTPDDVKAMLERFRDAVTVKRVYGDPIERDGVMVIPAANVRGGWGGGGGGAAGRAAELAAEGEAVASTGAASEPGIEGAEREGELEAQARAVGGFGYGVGGGVTVSPAGAYVIRGDDVEWVPAVDVNRTIVIGCVTAVISLLVLRGMLRTVVRR
jgi:uncharacterized spore protein YtfJ